MIIICINMFVVQNSNIQPHIMPYDSFQSVDQKYELLRFEVNLKIRSCTDSCTHNRTIFLNYVVIFLHHNYNTII